MAWLHRAHHPELGESAHVALVDELAVLDPVAIPAWPGPSPARRLDRVQHHPHRAVPDRVHRQVQPELLARPHRPLALFRRGHRHAHRTARHRLAIRVQRQRGPGVERSVGKQLPARQSHPLPLARCSSARKPLVFPADLFQLGHVGIHVHPLKRQLARSLQGDEIIDQPLGSVEVMGLGESQIGQQTAGRRHALPPCGRVWWRGGLPASIRRVLVQQARGLSMGVLIDVSLGQDAFAGAQARPAQRRRVRRRHVVIKGHDHARAMRRGPIQLLDGRPAALGPRCRPRPLQAQPRADRSLRRRLSHAIQARKQRRAPVKVRKAQGFAEQSDMAMRLSHDAVSFPRTLTAPGVGRSPARPARRP